MTTLVDAQEKPTRNVFSRIIFGILWLIPVYFLTNMIVGTIVGATAGYSTGGFDAGYASGYAASIAFFQKYGRIVLIAEIFLTAFFSFLGVFPGTGRYKREKR